MTLALEKKTIPPNINFNTPNPKSNIFYHPLFARSQTDTFVIGVVPFKKCKLTVPTEPLPWPTDRDELVGVNSFGIGGSNAHVSFSSVIFLQGCGGVVTYC